MKKEIFIVDILKKCPSASASVAELSKELRVSENTIRRYTLALEKQGLIIRYHGGAILKDRGITHKHSLSERAHVNIEHKKIIAEHAAHHIKEETIVFVDLGSTCKQLLEILLPHPNITIITPYVALQNLRVQAHKTTNVIITGGIYDAATEGVYGVFTEDFFKNVRPHLAFMGVNGVSEIGLSINNAHETGYKRAAIAASEKVIVLADASKIQQNGISSIARLDDIDLVITNKCAEADVDEQLARKMLFV